jgi:uncharacterized protein
LNDIWILVAIMLSGLIAGITGFGFGLVSMGALITFMPVTQATAMVAILTLCVMLMNLWSVRHALQWRESSRILVTSLPATALGVYLLTSLNTKVLSAGVGVMILAGCVLMFWCPPRALLQRAWPWGYVAGLLGGIFGGALGTGGPPIVFYTMLRGWDKSETKGLLCAYFTVTGIWRIILLATQGIITTDTVRRSAILLIPALAASYLGIHIFRRLSTPVFRYATLALLVGLAVKSLVA